MAGKQNLIGDELSSLEITDFGFMKCIAEAIKAGDEIKLTALLKALQIITLLEPKLIKDEHDLQNAISLGGGIIKGSVKLKYNADINELEEAIMASFKDCKESELDAIDKISGKQQ